MGRSPVKSRVVRIVSWCALVAASVACAIAVLVFFNDAFPVLDLDVRMSRTQAIDAARRIAIERRLADAVPDRAVARFQGDPATQTFIELEGGGKPALKPFLRSSAASDDYTLFQWRVRLFTPGVEREVLVAFSPDGMARAFRVRIPEAAPGAALAVEDARRIAVDVATRDWHVNLDRYRASSAASITRPGGRVDHEFIYERRGDDPGAPAIGDGRLRLRLVVAGDRLVGLSPYVFVPEAFVRRYATMRSANDTIASFASVSAGLLYGLGGCVVGLVWLMRRHAVRWKPAMTWGAVVAGLIAASSLSAIPASWFDYDTATAATTHLATRIANAFVGGVLAWLGLTVVFAAAEGLGRLAFGRHPQLWRAWRVPAAASPEVWGRVLAGYAWIGFDLAFVALFYVVVQRWLGWWSPSDTLVDPNILGNPLPSLGPVSRALQAGWLEECLFRAVPLAGAALLGRRFGRERLFVIVALVVQAIVFGGAHANYPGQPAYARPVELFVPSLAWGLVYLRYGLVPGILFHFGFDLVLMSMPLFVTDVPGIAIDRALVVAALLVPIAVLTVQRWRVGRFVALPDAERNEAAPPTIDRTSQANDDATVDAVRRPASVDRVGRPSARARPWSCAQAIALAMVAAACVVGGFGAWRNGPDAPPLRIAHDEAIAVATGALAARGIALDGRWQASAKAVAVTDPGIARFVWREGGRETYARLIGNVLPPPHWEVRFARVDADVADRETWRVVVVDRGGPPDAIRVIEHDVPESRPGSRLVEADARALAERAIVAWFAKPVSTLKRVAAEAIERPARLDWEFVYTDPAVVLPAGAEARISVEVDGDEVVSLGRRFFVPDAKVREERARAERLLVPRIALGIVGIALSVALIVSLVLRVSRGDASLRASVVGGALVAATMLASNVLAIDAARWGFAIDRPFDAQLVRAVLRWTAAAIGAGLAAGLVTGVGVRIARLALDDEVDRDARRSRRDRWLVALGLAATMAGVLGIATVARSSSAPRVPSIGYADSLASWLSAFLGPLDFPAAAAAGLLAVAIASSWPHRRRRWITAGLALVFMVGPMLAFAATPEANVGSIAIAGAIGVAGWALFTTFVRDRPLVVAPTLFVFALIEGAIAFASTFTHAVSPGVRTSAVCEIAGAIAGYAIWRWLVARDRDVTR